MMRFGVVMKIHWSLWIDAEKAYERRRDLLAKLYPP